MSLSSRRRWSLASLCLSLAFAHGCGCGVAPPGTDAGDPVTRDGGVDPKPIEDGGDNEEDSGPIVPDAGPADDDAGPADDDAGPEEDDGGPDEDDAGPEEDDAGPGDDDAGPADDAGPDEDDAGPEEDDGGPDAGPNVAPVIGSFTSSAASVDDPGSVTLSVVADDANQDDLSYTYSIVGTQPAGISIAPSGASADASATVSFDGTVPRGSYEFRVEVSDGESSASETVAVTVNNHAPTASAGPHVTVIPASPAAEAALGPVIDDVDLGASPADVLTVVWSGAEALPDGVTFDATTPSAPSVSVDRALYQQDIDEVGFSFTLTVTVTDDAGESATDTVTITVADERGGHVDNTSAFSGTGPAGFCGSLAHPCSNLADAQANLTSLIAADGAVANELLVATSGTDYQLDASVVLEAGRSLRCGFDPNTLDDAGEWEQSAARTPLRSTADFGIVVQDTAANGLVSAIQRCDVVMLDQDTDAALRIGIDVNGAGARLTDNHVLGSHAANTQGSAVAVRGVSAAAVTLEDNDLNGGAATNNVAGVSVVQRSVTFTGNTIRGGSAPTLAVGVTVTNAQITMTDNPSVVGGDAESLSAGLLLGAGTDGSVLSGNDFVGSEVTDGQYAVGAMLLAGATLSGNDIRSGPGAAGTALLVSQAVTVTSELDVYAGEGTLTTVGVQAENGAIVTLTTATVSAPGNGNALSTIGVKGAGGAALTLVDSAVNAGDALGAVVGVQAIDGAASLTLESTGVTAGDSSTGSSIAVQTQASLSISNPDADPADPVVLSAGAAPAGSSLGISADCSAGAAAPVISDVEVRAGAAALSVGAHVVECVGSSLSDAVVTGGVASKAAAPESGRSAALVVEGGSINASGGSYSGNAADVSSGGIVLDGSSGTLALLMARGGDVSADPAEAQAVSAGVVIGDAPGAVSLTTVEAVGGAVSSATESQSLGVAVTAADVTFVTDNLSIDESTLRSSAAEDRSAALWLGTGFNVVAVTGSILSAGSAGYSAGLVLSRDGTAATIEDNTITAGDSVGAAPSGGESASAGLWMGSCHGCLVQRNVVEGAGVELATGRSIGVRVSSIALSQPTYVTNNVIRAGAAMIARGIELGGNAGGSLRFLHNNVFGGGDPAGVSAAVFLGQTPPAVDGGDHQVASFGGNLIDVGLGATRVGYWENCIDDGGLLVHTFRPSEARNSNFWPNVAEDVGVVYLRDASGGLGNLGSCASANVITVAAVNATTNYAETNGGGCTSQSFDRDPGFTDGRDIGGAQRDGVHISDTSPLRNSAPGTYANGGCGALGPLWDNGALGDMLDFDVQVRPLPAGEALDIGVDEVD